MIKNEKGQATVELAFSLVILITFLFGIIDFGRIFHAYLTIEHAGREAARVASLGATNSDIIAQAQSAAPSLNTEDIGVSISPSISTSRTRGSYVTVQLSYPISFSIPLFENMTDNPLTLRSKTVMRVE